MPEIRLIAGSGRSGTTWVQDSLATANRLRTIFEPLHPYVSEIGDRYAHRALGSEDDHPELAQFLADVCAGRRNRFWTLYRRQRRWLLPPPDEFWTVQDAARVYRRWGKFLKELPSLVAVTRGRAPLVKCIRANLMLGWLSRRLDCKTILIVRHPGAVIESELRSGWSAQFALERFRQDSRLNELTSGRFRSLLDRQLTPVEALATRWVVENQWVVERAAANGVTVVHYENLISNPEREWRRIRTALDLEKTPPREVIVRPSQQSAPKGSAAAIRTDDPRWLSALSREQADQIQAILNEGNVELYSMSDPEPRRSVEPANFDGGTKVAS